MFVWQCLTSLYLMSMATGQNTMSANRTTSRIFSFKSKTAISQAAAYPVEGYFELAFCLVYLLLD